MATISNVNGKKITKIKYKGEIFDTGSGGSGFNFFDNVFTFYSRSDLFIGFCGRQYIIFLRRF